MNPYVYLFGAIIYQAAAQRRIGGALHGIILFDDIHARTNSAWGGLCNMEWAWRVHRRFAELLSAQSEFELASCARFGADCHRCDIGQQFRQNANKLAFFAIQCADCCVNDTFNGEYMIAR